jgi:hypothetical protein
MTQSTDPKRRVDFMRDYNFNFKSDIKTPDNEKSLFEKHGAFFENNNAENIFEAREGGYVNLPSDIAETVFQDGMAGDMAKEFELAGHPVWMIRDPTKILCRLVNEYEISIGRTENVHNFKDIAVKQDLQFSRAEPWNSCVIQAQKFGTELLNKIAPQYKLREEKVSSNLRNQSNNYTDKILEAHNQKVPTKVLLTGKLFFS